MKTLEFPKFDLQNDNNYSSKSTKPCSFVDNSTCKHTLKFPTVLRLHQSIPYVRYINPHNYIYPYKYVEYIYPYKYVECIYPHKYVDCIFPYKYVGYI